MDKETLRDIWHGQLPLCFKLHPDDVSGMHRPEPYYMMVPRITYFPIVLDRVVKYFNRFMDTSKSPIDNMWLDYEGQPIKWQHPIGLSWDLFGTSYDLPWRLMLHFSEFPAKDLVKCNTKSSIKALFMSSIKEADALKHKGSVTKNMLEKDQNVLWSSLVNDKFDQFWTINKRLMDRIDNELFKFIPFRLYLPDYTYIQKTIRPCTIDKRVFLHSENNLHANSSATKTDDATHSHEPQNIPPVYDKDIVITKSQRCSHSADELDEAKRANNNLDHRYTTLLDLIQTTFGNRLDDLLIQPPAMSDGAEMNSEKDKERDNETQRRQDEPPLEEQRQLDRSLSCHKNEHPLVDVRQFKYRFLTHGIEIPFDTPLQWLSEHLSYPDNFLHICAVSKDGS